MINQGMATNAQNLQNYLSTWDNYREIWEINKDMFIKRYQNLNPQVASFDADIARSVSIIMMEIKEHIVVHFSTSINLILLNNFSLKYCILFSNYDFETRQADHYLVHCIFVMIKDKSPVLVNSYCIQ